MTLYKNPYFTLFYAICDTIESLEELMQSENLPETARQTIQAEIDRLKASQQEAEELLIAD
ncbi:MAG: hypothetical protein IJ496_02695 [Ruminococcus sp.]|nr:hypothetical protein [Ruminococcus sp.]